MVLRRFDSLWDRIRALSGVPSLPESPPIVERYIYMFLNLFVCLSVYVTFSYLSRRLNVRFTIFLSIFYLLNYSSYISLCFILFVFVFIVPIK